GHAKPLQANTLLRIANRIEQGEQIVANIELEWRLPNLPVEITVHQQPIEAKLMVHVPLAADRIEDRAENIEGAMRLLGRSPGTSPDRNLRGDGEPPVSLFREPPAQHIVGSGVVLQILPGEIGISAQEQHRRI